MFYFNQKKIKDKLLLGTFTFLTCTSAMAQSATMALCEASSQAINKNLPMKEDNVTILRKTGCVPSSPKNRFIYIMEISAPLERLKNINIKGSLKPNVLNTFCSDPQVRVFLNAFDVDHRYYTNKGEYVDSFLMESKECK